MSAETSSENPTAITLDIVPDESNGENEVELVTQARNGSMSAVEELVARYERRLFRLAQNITGNHEDTEEVVQNAFAKAFQKPGRISR
jgi:DNA-directed RNA polymerase specialized sigma24 family protein